MVKKTDREKKTTIRLDRFDFDLVHAEAAKVGLSVPEYLVRAGKKEALRAQLLAYQGGDAPLTAYFGAVDASTAELWTRDTK